MIKISFVHLLGAWWSIALFLATFQVWGMFKIWWTSPIGLFIAALCFYAHHLLAVHSQTRSGKTILILYALGNTIPLILQIAGLKEPGFDNLIAAGIGLGLLLER